MYSKCFILLLIVFSQLVSCKTKIENSHKNPSKKITKSSKENRDGLTAEAIKTFLIPLPNIAIQETTILEMNLILHEFDEVESKLTTQIQKLKDYRQSLISEAVTGKIDLRNWKIN